MNGKVLQPLKLAVKFLIAGILLFWMLHGKGREMLQVLFPGGRVFDNPMLPWIAGCGLLILAQIVMTAFRWYYLIPPEFRPGIGEALVLTFKGVFANMFIPAGAVGGDVVKIGIFAANLSPERRVEAAVSVLADRIAGMAGLFSLTLMIFLLYFQKILTLAPAFRSVVFFLAALCCAGLGGAAVIFFPDFFFRFALMKKMLVFADRILKNVPSETIRSFAAYRKRWKTLLASVAASALLMHPCLLFAVYVPLAGIMQEQPPVGAALAGGAFGSTASVVPVTPGGLGTRDLVSKNFMTSFGISERDASAATLIYTAMYCCIMASGGIFFLFSGKGKKEKK